MINVSGKTVVIKIGCVLIRTDKEMSDFDKKKD
jgi:hypothetical protein